MTVTNRRLLLTVFFSGLVTLAVELSAFRLFAPVFGASNLISAVVIGLIMLYLSAGYWLGGRWADRSPRADTLYRLIVWAAFIVGVIPFIAQPLLKLTRDNLQNLANFDAALLIFAFLITLVLFAVPVTLLGCVSPFALRLSMASVEQSGRTAGRLYAISTLGSFIGSFTPELILLNWVGTRGTFVVLALILIGIGLIGLGRKSRALIVLPIILIALHVLLPISFSDLEGTLYQGESSYNFIQVVERGGTRYLLLNDGQGVHSIYNPATIQTNGTWDYFALAPYFNATPTPVQRVGLIGLAGGTLARSFTELFGPIPIDGIEIDPKIVAVGRAYFGMTQPNLNVIVGDGRAALSKFGTGYSVIGLDAFRVPYIPWHLTTREYLLELRARLAPNGVIVANVGRTRTDYSMVDAMARTAATVFPSVHVIDVAGSLNSIVYATMRPTSLDNLRANLPLMHHAVLTATVQLALQHARPLNAQAALFTDDNAPVERLTNGIMLNFLFGGSGLGE